MSYVNIGIEDLDLLLGEGVLEGSLILLLGDVGSGAELFAQQALYKQVENGVKCVYFLVEKQPEDVKSEMSLYGFDVQAFEDKGDWLFIPIEEQLSLLSLSETLVKNIRRGVRTFIDSFSPIILKAGFKETIRLIKTVKATARTSGELHFIHVVRGMHGSFIESTLKHYADGVFEFEFRPAIRGVGRLLILSKLRGVIPEFETLPYKITSKGITIETATRIV